MRVYAIVTDSSHRLGGGKFVNIERPGTGKESHWITDGPGIICYERIEQAREIIKNCRHYRIVCMRYIEGEHTLWS
jgi:hypothetical protein